jgi:ABC-type multidrug transport system, ATPase component
MLTIKNLTKVFPNNRGIFDLNLNIERGQIFGFLGRNGSGKTTTLKLISGLLNSDKGEILFENKPIEENFEQVMRNVGCMFESVAHYNGFSAYDNMLFIARFFQNVPKSRIDEVLEQVGLLKHKKEKVSTFSLGMRQRLAFAQAMYNKPKLMLLDEPLNGLDIQGMLEIRSLIKELAANGVTFLISSHLSAEVEKTCTHVAIIQNGQIIDVTTKDEVLKLYPSVEDYYIKKTSIVNV